MNNPNTNSIPTVAIIGGGPAGLMAAETLIQAGVKVDVYDAMPSVGRKFLMAGKGGMNISHSEPFDRFVARYGARREFIEPMLREFTPTQLRQWVHGLGIDTFVGTSGRIFPTDMKAAPLLRAWLHRLRAAGVVFHVRHRWLGWDEDGKTLRFDTPEGECKVQADAVVLALGGGSWAKLGSTGTWVPLLSERGVNVAPLKPSNCGFETRWSAYFAERYAGQPIKPVKLSFTDAIGNTRTQQGELMVTATGLEGSLIYALSGPLRDRIEAVGEAVIYLDLLPDLSMAALITKLSKPRGKLSMANHLRKRLGIEGVKASLLRERLPKPDMDDTERLSAAIKALPVKLHATRPLDEAISSAGGVTFEDLNKNLMLRPLPGVFCAGEMLDFEAPTGGYLLTESFASGRKAGAGVLTWLNESAYGISALLPGL